jgi:hypothetical protein
MSEAYLNRVFPAMRSAYPTEWLGVIDRALAIGARTYVPGHGFIEGPAVSRAELLNYRKALQAVIAEVKRLHDAGVPVDEAIKQANFGEYQEWKLHESQRPIAVRRVYDELDALTWRPNPSRTSPTTRTSRGSSRSLSYPRSRPSASSSGRWCDSVGR